MAVQIKIDQAAHAPGIAGRAREDLATGTPVTLTAVGGPYAQYQWTIGWKPVDVIANTRSAAALSAATSVSTLLTPIDQIGTYRISIVVDSGNGLGAGVSDNASITFYAGPTLAAAGFFPRRRPAIGETTEHNVLDAIDPVTGNPDGWGREEARWDEATKKIANVSGTVVRLPFSAGLVSTSNPSGTPYRVADLMFDRSKLMLISPATLVKLFVELETTDVTSAANIDLIDVDGIATGGGGVGTVIAGSPLNTTSLTPVALNAVLTAPLAGAAAGRLRLRLWAGTAGKFCTYSYGYIELS